MTSIRTATGSLALSALLAAAGCGGYDNPSQQAEAKQPQPTAVAASHETPAPVTPAPDDAASAKRQKAEALADAARQSRDVSATATTATTAVTADTADTAAPVEVTTDPVVSTLRVEPTRLVLGTVSTNKFATGTVTLTNVGAEPITITQCKTSCGCTSANCPKGESISPGMNREVEIRINAGARARTITKEVTFMVEGQQPVKMPVTVDVIAYVTMEPETLDPEKDPAGKVVLRSSDEQPFRIVSMSPAVIEDFPDTESTEHELFLDWERWKGLGQQRRVVFNIDHPETDQISALVRYRQVANRVDPGVRNQVPPTVQLPGTQQPDQDLQIAVKYGEVDKLRKLLSAGMSQADRDGLLGLASRYGQAEIGTVLLDAGANVNAKDRLGRSPLHSAIQSRKGGEMVTLLLAHKADVNARDSQGGTALMRAAGPFGDAGVVTELIQAGADVNAADNSGQTPLMWAARWGDVARVKALKEAGADAGARDQKGMSAIEYAKARSGEEGADEIVSLLQAD